MATTKVDLGKCDSRAFTWPNKAILRNGVVEVFCSHGRSFTVDYNCYEKIKHVRWSMDVRGVVDRKLPLTSRRIKLHRFLMSAKQHEFVDHINRDPSDNTMTNLRIVTKAQNLLNRIGNRKKTLPKGVFRYGERFKVQLTFNGITYSKYGFKCHIEAATYYNKLAKIHHGEYAKLNEVE